MLLSRKRQGVWDCHLGSNGAGSWCFVNYDLHAPWFHILLDEPAENDGEVLLTNDIGVVKHLLDQACEGLKIKSLQAVFPCDFPDNNGWGIAEINQINECKTRKGEIFHTLRTRFGSHRIGGPERVMATDVLPYDQVTLYEAERVVPPKLYYRG